MDTCPDCGSSGPLLDHGGRCRVCAMGREREQHRQMRARSGPQYKLSASRSRAASAAYRAAGSSPKVRAAMMPVTFTERDGQLYGLEYETRYYLARSMRGADWIEATPEQVAAWVQQRSGSPAPHSCFM